MLAQGCDCTDVAMTLGCGPEDFDLPDDLDLEDPTWGEEDDEDLDYGGVPMRDEGWD